MEVVIHKLKFKGPGMVVNAPEALEKEFKSLGCSTTLSKEEASANTLVFVNNKEEFTNFLTQQIDCIVPDSVLWFAYPKGTSKIKTDINRDILRETAEAYGITTVAAISIDSTWSGLRFRPMDRVGK